MKIYMIRHGATKGNREHRYVGCTDESVLPEEKRKLAATRQKWKEQGKLQVVSALYVSPMKRCRETAEILYPGIPQTITEDFRECNFGEFEYRNFEELNGNPDYQRFIDTFGEVGFPGGETKREFQKRCADRMEELLTGMADMKQDRKENGGKRRNRKPLSLWWYTAEPLWQFWTRFPIPTGITMSGRLAQERDFARMQKEMRQEHGILQIYMRSDLEV